MQRFLPDFFILTHESAPAWTISDSLRNLHRESCGVVLRAYNLEKKARLTLGDGLAQLCRARRFLFLVAVRHNIDLTIATHLRADGLHLPEWVARQQILAPMLGWCRQHRKLLTIAAHGARGLARGRQLGADAVFLSPVFRTTTHVNLQPIGYMRFRHLCHVGRQPVIALGGIRFSTIRLLQHSQIIGIAIGQPLISVKVIQSDTSEVDLNESHLH